MIYMGNLDSWRGSTDPVSWAGEKHSYTHRSRSRVLYRKYWILDTVTSIKDGYINTNLYCKLTYKRQYLHRTSDHPKHVKKSIPYGVGIRMKRICSDENDYQNHAEKLIGYLTRRGYKGYDVKNSYIKWKTLIEKKSSNTETNLNRKNRNEYPWLPHIRSIYLT